MNNKWDDILFEASWRVMAYTAFLATVVGLIS